MIALVAFLILILRNKQRDAGAVGTGAGRIPGTPEGAREAPDGRLTRSASDLRGRATFWT